VFGRPALENIARGFGLRGHEIRDVSIIPKLFADFTAQGESEIWNIQISDQVTAPVIRQTIKRGTAICERDDLGECSMRLPARHAGFQPVVNPSAFVI